jgi:hypothetical protein
VGPGIGIGIGIGSGVAEMLTSEFGVSSSSAMERGYERRDVPPDLVRW